MSTDNAPPNPGSSDAASRNIDESVPSSSGAEASRTDMEPSSTFEDMELKDGELSRLQALLEARGVPPHLIGSLGPRMHQLLHRTISSSSGGKVQQMLSGIQSSEEGQQLQSVIEMCQFLVMGNEESLVGFPVKQVVPALVSTFMVAMEPNFGSQMNHGCRALTYLMEALPRSTAVVVEAVPVFIEKLQVIQCMDVAEQALTALAMLSRRHGKAILQAGGMSACLLYLDFFSISAQRSALSVAHLGIFSVDSLLFKPQHKTEQGLWQWRDDRGLWHTYSWIDSKIIEAAYENGEDELTLTTLGRTYTVDFNSMQQTNEDTGTSRQIQRCPGGSETSTSSPKTDEMKPPGRDEREVILSEETELASSYTCGMFSALYKIFSSSVGPAVRHKCVDAILRVLCHAPPDLLGEVLKRHPISSLIGGMLQSSDLRVITNALQMADIVMKKLPDVYHVSFRREGVMHKVRDLANGLLANKPSASEKNCSSENLVNSNHEIEIPAQREAQREAQTSLPVTRRLGEVLRRKRYSKRPNRGKAASMAGTSEVHVEVNSHSAGAPSSRTLLQESRASFLSSQSSSKSNCRSAGIAERPAKLEAAVGNGITENREKILTWIKEQATKFCSEYFDQQKGDSHPALSVLRQLKGASEQLTLVNQTFVPAFKEISDVLTNEDNSACAFEILHSGIVPNILKYLTSTAADDALPQEKRLRIFFHVFMGLPEEASSAVDLKIGDDPQVAPLNALIQKLHLCINQLEQLPVKVHDTPGGAVGTRGSQALRFFSSHQIKCLLQRHPDCEGLRQWNRGPVKIDPLALVQAVERYLVVRGYGKKRESPDDDESEDDGSDDDIDESLATELQGQNNSRHQLEILLGDHLLPYNMTVYQAIKQFGLCDENKDLDDEQGILGRPSIWVSTHTIWFRPLSQPQKEQEAVNGTSPKCGPASAARPSRKTWKDADFESEASTSHLLSTCEPQNFSTSDPSIEVISLMKALHVLNSHWTTLYEGQSRRVFLSCNEFINNKLAAKVFRQLQDPITVITGNFPAWIEELPHKCPFLFPFECRQQLFYCTAMDRDRALSKLQETLPELMNTEASDRVAPRFDRKKVRVHFGIEVAYVYSPSGLYPAPLSRNAKTAAVTKLCSKFQFLGKFLARAIMDFRILDIPFCQILYKWLLNQEGTLDLGDLAAVDPILAQSLRQLQQVVQRKRQLEQDPSHTPDSRQLAVESLTLDGMPIEDLGLSFALPGYPEVELKPLEGNVRSDDDIDESLATELQGQNNSRHQLEILLGDHLLPYNMTVYQAIKQFGLCDENKDLDDEQGILGRPSIWVSTHTIWFRPLSQPLKEQEAVNGTSPKCGPASAARPSRKTWKDADFENEASTSHALSTCEPQNFSTSDPSIEVISLMKALHVLNSHWTTLYESFAPAARNREQNDCLRADPITVITGNFPAWIEELPHKCPFLFPFECRQQLFYCTAMDRDRALSKLQETLPELMNTEASDRVAPRFDRKKYSPSGLYPAPLSRNAKTAAVTKLCSKFQFLGKFLARAIMDFRILDIPFCQILYKWLLNQEGTLDLGDLAAVDPILAQSLRQLQQVVQRKRQLEQDPSHTPDSRQLAVESLTLDGMPIEDLGLSFALPGYPEVELKRGGNDVMVTVHNLEEYIKLVIQWTLIFGVKRQLDALREGFNSVLPLSNLTSFTYSEMEQILCGNLAEKWDIKCLVESCRPDHGYTHDSRAVKELFEILSCYSQEEQRLFLQFVTGSPRLPVGGLRSLNPPLTIVRKSFEPPLCADSYLPSVMTCVNYLKLPDYSSKEIMASKLKLAAQEGQRSFHLS
ncbi:PREDICTED: E3 ubiquitin-protein ligase TRIP12-like [Acropora digitifera]|uniref:E3 ubiquitin-protein ligase TRIP12-like n=1 Tax=Acropora digitifera TaxID=70779 RepID=UPI00077A15FA|nr:PREDICTED: E3 ubiquitin-protein ligase TRIP12-like [Acropora digitifera]